MPRMHSVMRALYNSSRGDTERSMECNKEEAARSKAIAESKFEKLDIVGARKFALKARQLFPDLVGLSQLISILDVHIAAHEKLQGTETNWYGVLQVDSNADENTIRKQYRKLALLLHPDKNKAFGAEAAFKHISEGWSVLSDRVKKAAYDKRCRAAMASQGAKTSHSSRVSQHKSKPFNMSRPNQGQGQAHVQGHREGQGQAQVGQPPQPAVPPNMMTFWTACPSCKMQLEYERVHINKNLCCPICHRPFVSKEIAPVRGAVLWPPQAMQGFKMDAGPGRSFDTNFTWPPHGNVNVPPMVHPQPSKKEKGGTEKDNTVEGLAQQGQKVKREAAEARVQQAQKSKQKRQKKIEKDELKAKVAAQAKEDFDRLIARSKGVIEQKLSAEKEKKAAADKTVLSDQFAQNLSAETERKTAVDKTTEKERKDVPDKAAACDQFVKSELWTAFGPKLTSTGSRKENNMSQEGPDSVKIKAVEVESPSRKSPQGKRSMASLDHESMEGVSSLKKPKADTEVSKENEGQHIPKGSEGSKKPRDFKDSVTSNVNSLQVNDDDDAMEVPDSDFYDFDKDRTEKQFSAGQIWASYDDDDGMPRYYARVNKVLSFQPFKMQMTWLEARSPSDKTLAWLDSGFSYTCGDFKLGSTYVTEHLNTFSHLMTVEKGLRGVYKIYPRQGEVWAVYKDWDTLKVKDEKHGYDMVEVLAAFKEEVGVEVSILFKVEGFKTLFQGQPGEEHAKWVPPHELRRFSHQVPAHRLMVGQALGIQKDCWELDPASTPMYLITGKQ